MALNRQRLIFFGAFTHLLAIVFSIGYHQCDELFQVFEFAGYKLGINSAEELPWEFTYKMRSAIPPLLVYLVTNFGHYMNIRDPFVLAICLRGIVGLISFIAYVRLLKLQSSESIINGSASALWILAMLWWSIPYFHVRLSAENLSATIFLWAFILYQEYGKQLKKYFLPGLLLALAFHIRFQTVFMFGPLFLYMIFVSKESFKSILLSLLGFAVGLTLATGVDYWFYGEITCTWWNYIYQNIFESKAAQFGIQPFYFFLTESLVHLIPPYSLLIVLGVVVFWYTHRMHVITWITLPFVLIHFFVGHKEFRFIFPIMNFLPFMLIAAKESWHKRGTYWKFLETKWVVQLFLLANLVALFIFCLSPADSATRKMKSLYYLNDGLGANVCVNEESPYSPNLGLNYFHHPFVRCYPDSLSKIPYCKYYYTEEFNLPDTLMVNGIFYQREFSSIPRWAENFDFNGWMSRVPYFSIYVDQNKLP